MTFSILAFDEETGTYGAAAATGSLCVGGWVLRGGAESGLSASQGTSPSTLWGEEVLARMRAGETADRAVAAVTAADPGRAHRQLAAIDPAGGTAQFTGEQSVPWSGTLAERHAVLAGNMLAGGEVLSAARDAYRQSPADMADRLVAALRAGEVAGGDARGLKSAALLVVSRRAPPLTLRIDHSDDPITALVALLAAARAEPYHGWTRLVPTLDDPYRT